MQESPIYRYLCDLSPLKPARSVHVAQTYSELSLPPPPAVFTSPPPNSHRPAPDPAGDTTATTTTTAVYAQPAAAGYAPATGSVPDASGGHGHQGGAGHGNHQISSSSTSAGMQPGQQQQQQSHAAPPPPPSSAGQSSSSAGDSQHCGGGGAPDQCCAGGGSSSSSQCIDESSRGCHNSAAAAHQLCLQVEDQHNAVAAADRSHGGQCSATSLDVFVPSSPSRQDPADVELYLADLADAMTAEEILHYGDLHQEKEHLQHCHSTSRVGVTGQRGVRRRCLDFEAAEARRKSMGGCAPPRCGSAGSRGGSIPPQVLSDRAGSQSEATNSGRSPTAAADPENPGHSGHLDMQPVPSNLMRLSRCSSAKAKGEEHNMAADTSQSAARDVMPSPVSVSVPSRIGLHLNSLAGSSVTFSPSRGFSCSSMGMSAASLLGLTPISAPKEDPAAAADNHDEQQQGYTAAPPGGGGNLSAVSSTAAALATGSSCVSVVEITREERQDINVADVALHGNLKSTTCFRSVTLGVKSVQCRAPAEEALERRAGPKRLMPPQEVPRQNEMVELGDEFFESPRSPKKRRKSTAPADKSSEGCRRCNCKKSKCLKLYCECFAAGVYCLGPCTCQDCLNKPEYEEKVIETRLLIESRNPLAFAPKIVHAKDSNSPTSDEGTETPASARHKRGCNCKKSLCLKKYCECFQAGVGCSEGCRCEGCQNMYGRKEAYTEEQEEHLSQDALDDNELLESSRDVQALGGPMRSDRLRSGNKDWSPITPSFPHSGQARSSSRLRAAVKKRACRDTPGSPVAVRCAPKPPRSPVKPPRLTRAATNPRSCANNPRNSNQYSRNMTCSPVSTPKSRIATLSPRWDGLADICTLTPLAQAPVRPTPASASTMDNRSGASPSFSNRQCAELGSTYSGPSLAECGEFADSCSPVFKHPDSQSPATRSASNNCNHYQSPLHPQHTPASAHPTPPTPSLSSSQGTAGGKPCFSSNADILPAYLSFDSADDIDTPDFLKYSEAVVQQSPQILAKTNSPKQIKRVSPPHYDGLLKDRGSRILSPGGGGSPSGLRNGRKFILQALPSFPSLTPYSSLRGGQLNSG